MKFKNGVSGLADAVCPGRTDTACTPDRVEKVERVIRGTCVLKRGFSHGSAHHILHGVLQYDTVL
jgi:hypothetical protein